MNDLDAQMIKHLENRAQADFEAHLDDLKNSIKKIIAELDKKKKEQIKLAKKPLPIKIDKYEDRHNIDITPSIIVRKHKRIYRYS